MIVRGGDCDGKFLKCYFLYYYNFFNTGLFNNERLSKNFDNVYNDYISHNTISQISYHITKASHPSYYNHLIFFVPYKTRKRGLFIIFVPTHFQILIFALIITIFFYPYLYLSLRFYISFT